MLEKDWKAFASQPILSAGLALPHSQLLLDICAEKGANLTNIINQEENMVDKDILIVINPRDGMDYWAGGVKEGGLHCTICKGLLKVSTSNLTMDQWSNGPIHQ